jgi:hypothetical protein
VASTISEPLALRRLSAVALAIVVACVGARASAAGKEDPRETARQLQSEGLKLLESGEALAALERFERAYALVPSPKILFNLGKTRVALGHEVEAFEAFDRFLAEAKDVPSAARAAAERYRDELRPRVALLNLEGEGGGAVWLDGRQVGVTPLPRAIVTKPGKHTLRVERDGRVAFAQTLELRPGAPSYVLLPGGGAVARVDVGRRDDSAARPSDEPAHAGLVDVPPPPSAGEAGRAPSVATAATAPSPDWRRPVAWGLAGGAALAVAFGVWKGATAYDAFNEYRFGDPVRDQQCNRHLENAGGPDCSRLLADGDDNRKLAIVGYATGATLAAASAVLFWLDSREAREPRLSCAVDARGNGGACRVRF